MLFNSDFKQINGTKRYFIHKDGYAFKTHNGKDYEIKINIIKGVPKVLIENRKISLVSLMIEYFIENLPKNYKVSHKITNNRIPLKNIKIKSISNNITGDELIIFKYKCSEKANAQNARVKYSHTITSIDVLDTLKRTNYKCFYCGDSINSSKWHLDHAQPLSNSGLNIRENLVASCRDCNMMKNSMDLSKFLYQCEKITKNNKH